MTKQDADFESFIAAWPSSVQEIAVASRKLIFEVLPAPLETIDTSSRLVGYGFGNRYIDMVCTLIPSKSGMKLGLAYGASLPDPKGLLAGDGRVHRHINLRSPADVRRAGVRPLLRAALDLQQSRAKERQSGR